MPHSVQEKFELTRKYFLDNEDLLINLVSVKTFKVLGSCIYFYGHSDIIGVVDFYSKEMAMKEFIDIVLTLNRCVEWRKKND